MRVAFVTPYLPSPANTGGRIRMFRLARALRELGPVHLYACASVREGRAQRARDELTQYARTTVRTHDFGAVPPWVAPLRVRRACPYRLARDLARDHAREPFDVCVVAHSFAAATARLLPRSVPLVVDEHNVESDYYDDYGAAARVVGLPPPRFDLTREIELLRTWEQGVWARSALVTAVSARDAAAISAHREGPVRVAPNGTALSELDYVAPSKRTGHEVLFVGLLSHAPNVAAALFLAKHVMPRVWAREPRAKLVLCGRSPSKEVLALESSQVEVTGTVERVAPYLNRAAVYANALAHGAGTSLKVPEALAAGVPMVSTEVGVRGFHLAPDAHYARADDAEGFAAEILRAMHERASLDERAARARSVAEEYDWATIGARFTNWVSAVARREAVPA